jgi:hypothetical protein
MDRTDCDLFKGTQQRESRKMTAATKVDGINGSISREKLTYA